MYKSGIQKTNCPDMPQMTSCFGIFHMHGLARLWKGKKPNSIAINIGDLLGKY